MSTLENNNASLQNILDILAERGVFNSPVESPSATYSDLKVQMKSVIKIFCQHTMPNFAMPWQVQRQEMSTSSGFVIEGHRIVCNAHGIVYGTNVQVRRHGDSKKYTATVVHVGHACDLAVLEVADPIFWEGLIPLELGDVPELQDRVTVVGYPTGGDNLCITSGVVSRVGVGSYAHSEEILLTIQIDAAINPGNSGGPAFCGDKVAGVAFESLDNAENCGYIIPVPVIRHFLEDIEKGSYTGFPLFNTCIQGTENVYLRRQKKIKSFSAVIADLYPEFSALRNRAIELAKNLLPNSQQSLIVNNAIITISNIADMGDISTPTAASAIQDMNNSDVVEVDTSCGKPHSILVTPGATSADHTIYVEDCSQFSIQISFPSTVRIPASTLIFPPNDTSDENCGVIISQVIPLSLISKLIKKNDVLMAFDNVPITADATINFRDGERIEYTHLFSSKFIGDTGSVIILRDGVSMEFDITCEARREFVPIRLFEPKQPYFVFMGLVFLVLSAPYLESDFGPKWDQKAPISLCEKLYQGIRNQKYKDEQIVVLSQVLAHDTNMGYGSFACKQVEKVNGVSVRNLAHLAELIYSRVVLAEQAQTQTTSTSTSAPTPTSTSTSTPSPTAVATTATSGDEMTDSVTDVTKEANKDNYLELTLSHGADIVLDVSNAAQVHNDILVQHQIPFPGASSNIDPIWVTDAKSKAFKLNQKAKAESRKRATKATKAETKSEVKVVSPETNEKKTQEITLVVESIEEKNDVEKKMDDVATGVQTTVTETKATEDNNASIKKPTEKKKAERKKAEPKKVEEKKVEEKKIEEKKAEPKNVEEKKVEEKKVEDKKTEAKKPEAKKSEAKKPEAKKSEVKKTEAKKPEEKKSEEKKIDQKNTEETKTEDKLAEAKKVEVKKVEEKKAEVKKSEAKKPEVKKSEAKKPEVKKPEVKKPEVKKSEVNKVDEKKKPETTVTPQVAGTTDIAMNDISVPEVSPITKQIVIKSKRSIAQTETNPEANANTAKKQKIEIKTDVSAVQATTAPAPLSSSTGEPAPLSKAARKRSRKAAAEAAEAASGKAAEVASEKTAVQDIAIATVPEITDNKISAPPTTN